MRLIAVLALGALVAGCAATPGTDAGPVACDAAANQSLIGSHVGAVSFPADANVRIVCTTCPMTRDYRPDRMNVIFDQESGIIEQVTCG